MKIGVVGLGRMGVPIARRVLNAGHELTVFNRTHERIFDLVAEGAFAADSALAVWERADVCITIVADDQALTAVTLGPGGLLRDGNPGERILVDMSTVSVDASAAVAKAAQEARVGYLRAPVSGNPSVVEAGNLGIMVSGDRELFDSVEGFLRDIGPNVFYTGSGEEARVMKLALNLMLAGTAELMAEAIVLGEASGLARETLLEVMAASAVGSPFVKYKTPGLLARDYTTTFSTSAMVKDLALVLGTAERAGVPLPATDLAQRVLQDCIEQGLGDVDFIALLPRLQREAGHPSDL